MYKLEVNNRKGNKVREYEDYKAALRAFHRAVSRAIGTSCDVYLWDGEIISDSYISFD